MAAVASAYAKKSRGLDNAMAQCIVLLREALAELVPAAVDCAELELDAGAMTGIDMANLEGLSSSNRVRSRLIDDMVGISVDANCVLVA